MWTLVYLLIMRLIFLTYDLGFQICIKLFNHTFFIGKMCVFFYDNFQCNDVLRIYITASFCYFRCSFILLFFKFIFFIGLLSVRIGLAASHIRISRGSLLSYRGSTDIPHWISVSLLSNLITHLLKQSFKSNVKEPVLGKVNLTHLILTFQFISIFSSFLEKFLQNVKKH